MTKTTKTRKKLAGARAFIKKYRNIFQTLILIALIYAGYYGFWLTLQFVMKTAHPVMAVETESMVPTYNVGDLVIIEGVGDKSKIKLNDVIVFHKPGEWDDLISHRVIDKEYINDKWYFLTKGDYNQLLDPGYLWSTGATPYKGWVPEDYVVGRIVGRIPFIGWFILIMHTPAGPIIIVILVLAIVIVNVYSLREEKK